MTLEKLHGKFMNAYFNEITDEDLLNIEGGISKSYAQIVATATSNAVSTWSLELSIALSSEYFYY
ncbi:hypothetical protein ABUK63_03525 [Lactococcus lactis]|uniref:hypothetical protein n=1 Tax=Lactococcus lactis TaxID=1358 RepID=UPI00202616F7|nr:hypothetical protein [Lactococcus lactis]MCL9638863.1 hypothetical protein [Lactococcus lactis]